MCGDLQGFTDRPSVGLFSNLMYPKVFYPRFVVCNLTSTFMWAVLTWGLGRNVAIPYKSSSFPCEMHEIHTH